MTHAEDTFVEKSGASDRSGWGHSALGRGERRGGG